MKRNKSGQNKNGVKYQKAKTFITDVENFVWIHTKFA